MTVAQTARLLSRANDGLTLFAVLAVLSDLKFGSIIRAQQARRDAAASEPKTSATDKPAAGASAKGTKGSKGAKAAASAAAEAPSAAGGAAPKVEDGREGRDGDEASESPPLWALALQLAAEGLVSMAILDPADKLAHRAAGVLLRSHRDAKEGVMGAFEMLEKVIEDNDVYQLFRFTGVCGGTGALLLTARMTFDSTIASGLKTPMAILRASLQRSVTALCAPRAIAIALLLAAFAVGNSSALTTLIRKPAVGEFLRACALLLRTLALVGTAVQRTSATPMPLWATLQCAAAAARSAHLLVFERVSLPALLGSPAAASGPDVARARCAVALEAFAVLCMLPKVFSRKPFTLLLLAFFGGCFVLVAGGDYAAALEPYVKVAAEKSGAFVVAVVLCIIFLGGFPTMFSMIFLVMLLKHIHGFDKLKV